MSDIPRISPAQVERLARGMPDTGELALPAPTQTPRAADVLTVVDLDAEPAEHPERAAAALRDSARIVVCVTRGRPSAAAGVLARAATCTLSVHPLDGRAHVEVADPEGGLARLVDAIEGAPRAATVLAGLLPLTAAVSTRDGLVAESLAYSTLLAGPEFAAWRASRPVRPVPEPTRDPVAVVREGDVLWVTLDRPERRNAFGHALRDGLVDALRLAAADPGITAVELRGAGPAFSAGGDLDEFGTAADPASAHVVRLARSAGWWVHTSADRVRAYLHGACVGAGIEVPAFADTVVAHPDAWFMLPELSLGLVPGAGGTVGVTARIGPWRTAWLALTGHRLDAEAALAWGLVDRIDPHG